MDPIIIAPTDETPEVELDAGNNKFEISGKSLPEDVTAFYDPILDWLDKYIGSPNSATTFVFKMEYFNTASSKMILDILLKLEELEGESEVLVKWYYREDDEDMEEAGEEYADIVDIPFEQISYD